MHKPSQMLLLPFPNPLNNLAPSKRLVPTIRKSYKMFFQMVTHSPSTSNTLSMGHLHWLPCPVTTGKGLGLGVFFTNRCKCYKNRSCRNCININSNISCAANDNAVTKCTSETAAIAASSADSAYCSLKAAVERLLTNTVCAVSESFECWLN